MLHLPVPLRRFHVRHVWALLGTVGTAPMCAWRAPTCHDVNLLGGARGRCYEDAVIERSPSSVDCTRQQGGVRPRSAYPLGRSEATPAVSEAVGAAWERRSEGAPTLCCSLVPARASRDRFPVRPLGAATGASRGTARSSMSIKRPDPLATCAAQRRSREDAHGAANLP